MNCFRPKIDHLRNDVKQFYSVFGPVASVRTTKLNEDWEYAAGGADAFFVEFENIISDISKMPAYYNGYPVKFLFSY